MAFLHFPNGIKDGNLEFGVRRWGTRNSWDAGFWNAAAAGLSEIGVGDAR